MSARIHDCTTSPVPVWERAVSATSAEQQRRTTAADNTGIILWTRSHCLTSERNKHSIPALSRAVHTHEHTPAESGSQPRFHIQPSSPNPGRASPRRDPFPGSYRQVPDSCPSFPGHCHSPDLRRAFSMKNQTLPRRMPAL